MTVTSTPSDCHRHPRTHLGLAADGITDLAPMRERIDDWRAFLDTGLDDEDRDAIRTAERTGRLRLKRRK